MDGETRDELEMQKLETLRSMATDIREVTKKVRQIEAILRNAEDAGWPTKEILATLLERWLDEEERNDKTLREIVAQLE